jgi:uncharacterized membrane protein YkvA (DUF1232 family)
LDLAYKDPRTPWYAKLLGALVVAYAFSPIDLIPDFVPILGYLDDLILLPLGIALVIKLIPEEVMEECTKKAEEALSEGKRNIWIAGVSVLFIWILVAFMILMAIIRRVDLAG